jgi:uncharacterized protein (TIGR02145 family)
VTATGFKYATNALLTSPTDVAGSGTTSPFTASLTGLTASTQYWAVGYATNSVGTSYGDTITFTTSASAFTCGTTVSYDGHNYTTVSIGSQCWFKENLRNDNYRDGTAIPGHLDDTAWSNETSGAQTIYNADSVANFATYGRLYNWYAVTDAAGLCPTGWHVPSDAEWSTLESGLGASPGTVMKAASPLWNGTNTIGFSALPSGYRNTNGAFNDQGSYGFWWSSSHNGTYPSYLVLSSGDANITRYNFDARRGFSVRCVQD